MNPARLMKQAVGLRCKTAGRDPRARALGWYERRRWRLKAPAGLARSRPRRTASCPRSRCLSVSHLDEWPDSGPISPRDFSQFSSVVEQRFCNLSEYLTVHQALDFPQLHGVSYEMDTGFFCWKCWKEHPFQEGTARVAGVNS